MKHTSTLVGLWGRLVLARFAIGLAAIQITLLSLSNAAEPIDKKAPTEIKVPANRPFTIIVDVNPSTGYSLGLKSMSPGVFLLSTEHMPRSRADSRPGAGSKVAFHFFNSNEAQGSKSEVVFSRFQPWDFKNTSVDEKFLLDVRTAQCRSAGGAERRV